MVMLIILVRDKATKKPLPWVSVEVNGASASTDAQGRVAFQANAGQALIKVRTQAYRPWTRRVDVPAAGVQMTVPLERALL